MLLESFFAGHSYVRDVLLELFDADKFLARAQGVQELINRGGTQGERDAAKEAMKRLIARAQEQVQELSAVERSAFERRFDAIRSGASAQAQRPRPNQYRREPPPRRDPPPRQEAPKHNLKVGDIVRHNLTGAMAEIVTVIGANLTVRWLTGARPSTETTFREGMWEPSNFTVMKKPEAGGTRQEEPCGSASDDRIVATAEFREGTSDKIYGVIVRGGRAYTFWGRRLGPYATKAYSSTSEAMSIFEGKKRKGYREFRPDSYMKDLINKNVKI